MKTPLLKGSSLSEIYLTEPNESFADEIALYRLEFLERGDHLAGCSFLKKFPDVNKWFEQVKVLKKPNQISKDFVPSSQYLCLRKSDNALVGMVQIRHSFNDNIEKYYGNIGYSVRPKERRKGYATQILKSVLPLCKEKGLDKVLLVCDERNTGSKKVIVANGGIYESTVFDPNDNSFSQRYWINL